MKHKRHFIQLIILISSMSLLFSVIIPHHHHDGGKTCFTSFFENIADYPCCTCGNTTMKGESNHHPVQTCNDCTATISVTSIQKNLSMDVELMLAPLFFVLLDYLYLTELEQGTSFFSQQHPAFFIEASYNIWITRASGLRAPPLF